MHHSSWQPFGAVNKLLRTNFAASKLFIIMSPDKHPMARLPARIRRMRSNLLLTMPNFLFQEPGHDFSLLCSFFLPSEYFLHTLKYLVHLDFLPCKFVLFRTRLLIATVCIHIFPISPLLGHGGVSLVTPTSIPPKEHPLRLQHGKLQVRPLRDYLARQ